MLDLFNNKVAFLKLKPKISFLIIIFILLLFLGLIYYTYKKEIYDTYQTRGIVSCEDTCNIITAIPTNIMDFKKIMLNNNYLSYQLKSKELKVDENNYISYYELVLSTPLSLTDKEIVSLNFYYNKQRIITKIKDKMF